MSVFPVSCFLLLPPTLFCLLVFPVRGLPVLRVEDFLIERHVRADFRVGFGRARLIVNHKDDFGRDPAAAFHFEVFVELRLLCERAVLACGREHSHEVEILFINPELRRM